MGQGSVASHLKVQLNLLQYEVMVKRAAIVLGFYILTEGEEILHVDASLLKRLFPVSGQEMVRC